MIKIRLVVLCCLLNATSNSAEIFINQPKSTDKTRKHSPCKNSLLNMFNSLKRSETSCSFKIAMYILDDKDLIDKLVELDANGDHAVMIVADKGNLEKNQLLKDKILGTNIYLGEVGVPYEKGNGQSLHHKFMIADCPDLIDKTGPYKNMPYKEVMLGSYNWSNGANYSNYGLVCT